MKQGMSDKITIAWFKIAEFVTRGQKERALGILRLLAHSLDDSALTSQLEGDVLLSFNDLSCEHKYQDAAEKYLKSERMQQAIAVYEHLVSLVPHQYIYREQLLYLYTHTKNIRAWARHAKMMLIEYIKKFDYQQINHLVAYARTQSNVHMLVEIVLFAMADLMQNNGQHKDLYKQVFQHILEQTTQELLERGDDESVAQLCNTVQVLDMDLHQFVLQLLS